MMELSISTTTAFIFAIFISLLFPASLYIWGFWQFHDRDDNRVIARNIISSTLSTALSFYIVLYLIYTTTTSTHHTTLVSQLPYLGLNWPLVFGPGPRAEQSQFSFIINIIWLVILEVKWLCFGVIIVCTLFLGPLVHNIFDFAINRNRARRATLSHRYQTHLQQLTLSSHHLPPALAAKVANLPFPFPHDEQNELGMIVVYELTHWYDAFHSPLFIEKCDKIIQHIQNASSTNQSDDEQPKIQRQSIKIVLKTKLSKKSRKYMVESIKRQVQTFVYNYTDSFTRLFSDFRQSLSITSLQQINNVLEDDNITTFRSVIISPVIEEVCYRCALYPLLYHYTQSLHDTILYSALFFATAHVHHFYRHWVQRGLKAAMISTFVQFTYCFLFALFCGYIYSLPYITTPTAQILAVEAAKAQQQQPQQLPIFSLPCAIVTHIICNAFGLPTFQFLSPHSPSYPRKNTIIATYVAGLIGFFLITIFVIPAA